jgi:hypothetical protein
MTRDQQMLKERIGGATFERIGIHHSVTTSGARQIVNRAGRRMIDTIHLDLLTSHATGSLPTFLIPDHAGPDFDEAVETVQWVCRELDGRGIRVEVIYRPVHNGVVIALADADPPQNSKATRSTR